MDRRGGQAVERKLLQIASAFADLALVGLGLAGGFFSAKWQRHVAGAAQRRALT
jgi:hypothetical protein